MGRELTRRYSSLFDKKDIRSLPQLLKSSLQFAHGVYKSGKISELASFVVWEAMHQLRLFARSQYMTFSSAEALALGKEKVSSDEFTQKVIDLCSSRQLKVTRSAHKWKLMTIDENGDIWGCLYPNDNELYKSTDQGESIVFVSRFAEKIKAIYRSKQQTLFVCTKGAVFRRDFKSDDGNEPFKKCLELSTPESFFRHNNEMTETPEGLLIIGEYGNVWENGSWRKIAYLYFSHDGGTNWQRSDFLIRQGINKHVHIIRYCETLKRLVLADGDNKKKVWLSNTLEESRLHEVGGWQPLNRTHIQMGGYISSAEVDGVLYLGTDYQGGTNFMVTTKDGKHFDKQIVPDPYRRSPIDNMGQRASKRGNEVWANLPYSTPRTKCLLMFTRDGGKSWERLFSYNGATHKVWLLSSANGIADQLFFSVENLKTGERAVYQVAD